MGKIHHKAFISINHSTEKLGIDPYIFSSTIAEERWGEDKSWSPTRRPDVFCWAEDEAGNTKAYGYQAQLLPQHTKTRYVNPNGPYFDWNFSLVLEG